MDEFIGIIVMCIIILVVVGKGAYPERTHDGDEGQKERRM
jgi:hypothetical protein